MPSRVYPSLPIIDHTQASNLPLGTETKIRLLPYLRMPIQGGLSALVLLLQEGVGKESGMKKEKAKAMEQIKEAITQEENVTEQWEASMAFISLQSGAPDEVPDMLVEGEEVLEEIPDLAVMSLLPIIIEGKEFLFLDDIAKTMGFREDEALSIIAMSTGVEVTSKEGKMKITFEDNLTKGLVYDIGSSSLEAVVAKALVQINQDLEFYESVPDSAFEPHRPVVAGDANDQGSIDLTKEQLVQIDDAFETAFEVDKFAMRIGGS